MRAYCQIKGILVSAWLLLNTCSLFHGCRATFAIGKNIQNQRSTGAVYFQYPGKWLSFSQGFLGTALAPGTPPWPPPPSDDGDLCVFISVSLLEKCRSRGRREAMEHPCPMPEGSEGGIELSTRAPRYFSGFVAVWNAWAG